MSLDVSRVDYEKYAKYLKPEGLMLQEWLSIRANPPSINKSELMTAHETPVETNATSLLTYWLYEPIPKPKPYNFLVATLHLAYLSPHSPKKTPPEPESLHPYTGLRVRFNYRR